jgi:CMP-N-acetylneuraminic acid synthetase
MNKFNYAVVIPARGGSKSIKNKNLQKINGKSLVQISIEKFKSLDNISSIIVTSDSDEILNEAKKYGAVPWKRPKSLSGDKATSESAIKDVLENCYSIQPNSNIIFHQCTSPLLKITSIQMAVKKFEETNATCVFTVLEEYNPIWKNQNKRVKILNTNDLQRKGRQERDPLLIETGGIYVINRKGFMKDFNRFGDNPRVIKVSRVESIDIDDEIDLIIASKLNEI